MGMQLRKLSYAMGVEVTGIDITRPLSDEEFAAVRKALAENCLLLFRGSEYEHSVRRRLSYTATQ